MFSSATKIRFQKLLSAFLIFTIFFVQTVQFPIVSNTQAAGGDAPNLVSVIVSESTNTSELKSRIKRYADDIQNAMSNTRVIIVEVPDNASPHNIAALNEKLFYEGDGNGISRLVGTVLIGSLPLPVVHSGGDSFLSIFPYTDFDDKVFVYDAANGYYEANKTKVIRDIPEIWHGVIMPNTGSDDQDRERIGKFLDKSHDFYTRSGAFSSSLAEPAVFYLDAFHDQESTSLANWKAYGLYLDNLEDIAYNRFNKHLAKTLYEAYQGFMDSGISTLDPATDALANQIGKDSIDFSSAPDIQTKAAILKSVKQFLEVFNEKYLGDILKFVYNTGRYGDGTNVRVDVAPVLISKQDEFMKLALKDANTLFEKQIDELVSNGLARGIGLATTYTITGRSITNSNSPSVYHNYYFGQRADGISSANQCSIVRGSSLAAEANRGYNVQNVQADLDALKNPAAGPKVGLGGNACFGANGLPYTQDTWGGNSPLNLKPSGLSQAELAAITAAGVNADISKYSGKVNTGLVLQSNRYTGYIAPTFDIAGSSEIKPGSGLSVNTPSDCYRSDFLADYYVNSNGYRYPSNTQGARFACTMPGGHRTLSPGEAITFENAVAGNFRIPECTVMTFTLGGSEFKKVGDTCSELDLEGISFDTTTYINYAYNKISSWIAHKSPTDEEYGAALKNMTTPSLAADKNRYIDFVSARGNVVKITYPNFYRLTWPEEQNLTAEVVQSKIKEALDAKSAEINALIAAESPAGGALYNYLRVGAYPTNNVDLYASLAANSTALKSVVDSVLWYNLRNATSKYAFTLENSLDRDGNVGYPLPGHKSDYEMAYIAGSGDAQNMHLKIDPASKDGAPPEITSIMSEYNALDNLLQGANVSDFNEGKATFKCGPPEGVPIWQWLPAVFCWIGTVLPPTISAGSCGPSPLGNRGQDRDFFTSVDANKDGIPDWQMDTNKNGILDGYEWIKDGNIELSADHKRLAYNTSTPIRATFRKDGKILAQDSFNEVAFDIKRVVAYEAGGKSRVVYARNGSGEISSRETLRKYVDFAPISVRAELGVAEYAFQAKNADIDVILDATVAPKDKNNTIAFTKVSNELTLEVRSESLDVATSSIINGEKSVSTTLEAGATSALDFVFTTKNAFGETLTLNKPLEFTIVDDVDDTQIEWPIKINANTYSYKGPLLTKAGTYRFEFTDAVGRFASKIMTIMPAKPVRIDAIASSSVFVRGQKDTVLVRAIDQFNNIAKGNFLKFNATVSGGAYFIESSDTKQSKTSVDGFSSFDLTSNNGGETETVKITIEGSNLEKTITLKSVETAKIQVEVAGRDNIVAGKDPHEITIKVLDDKGAVMSGFSGIASLDFPKNSGVISTSFVNIRDGVSVDKILFTPKYLAAENLAIDIQIPGIKDIDGNFITVLPDVPMRVGLAPDQTDLEARSGVQTTVTAKLFDRYGNLAYNHLEGMKAKFTVPGISAKYGRINPAEVVFEKWVARSSLSVTNQPGTAFFSVAVSPGLETNSFTVSDPSGASLVIKGYSSNASFVDTFYLWNKSKLERTNYNALYTTLLGADYGNVTEENYLGGEILFAPDSRSLAVTTTLNDATERNDVFSVTPGGKLTKKGNSTSLARMELESMNGRSSISVYDPFLRENVARLHLNLASDTALVACDTDGSEDIGNCVLNQNDRFVLLKGIGQSKVTKGRSLGLEIDGVKVLDIDPTGKITKYPAITIELDTAQTKNLLGFNIISGTTKIGYLAMKWNASHVEVTDPDRVNNTLAANPGVLVLEKISSRYRTHASLLGNSSKWARGVVLYEVENGTSSINPRMMGSSNKTGLEEYKTKQGIGFGNGSTSLLEFAAGASVGEATKFAATYSMINLGDPVAQLPELENGNKNTYNRTIGQKLTMSSEGAIETYAKIDTNGDGFEDIVVFYDDGRIELIQNYGGTLKSIGYLAYVVDAGKDRKWTGDFAKDAFTDIVMVDKDGKLIVLDNAKGKFARMTPRIFDEAGKEATIKGSIMQLETFDMDKDGFDDIVTTDDSGELCILYGGSDGSGTRFTKKVLATDLGLRLTTQSMTEGGAMYWDGLPQIKPVDQLDYAAESNDLKDSNGSALSAADQKRLLDSKLYYTTTTNKTVSAAQASDIRLRAGTGDDPENPGSPNTALMDTVKQNIADIKALGAQDSINTDVLNDTTVQTSRSYLRSEFLDAKDVLIAKTYKDKNGGTLQSGDRVEITLSLTNTGTQTLSSVDYLDSNALNVFKETDTPTFTRTNGAGQVATGALNALVQGEFDYQFTGFNIAPKETVKITYEMNANALAFGKFRVGLIEKDDELGDVAMNANGLCGEAEIIWKTVNPRPRSYEKITKEANATPAGSGQLQGRFTDFNRNGQPDYIDLISGSGDNYSLSSNQWDATKNGILVFREALDSSGNISGGSIEVGRIIADGKKGFIQQNSVSEPNDTPVLPTAGLVNGSKGSNGFSAGNPTGTGGLEACGGDGFTTTNIVLSGWQQTMKESEATNLTGNFTLFATGSKVGSLGTSTECAITFNETSNPTWSGTKGTTGIGWKILTKATFTHFALAAQNVDIRKTNVGLPDNAESASNPFLVRNSDGSIDISGLSRSNVDAINNGIDTIIRGLGCGFGGGSCLSLPLNWAPLAPGSAPVAFGIPLGPLTPYSGIPAFSAVTWCGATPGVWPPCSVGAGGMYGYAPGPFRLFITPTITGAIGTAMCFGDNLGNGFQPPPGWSPFVPGGGCIVAAKPLIGCKDDGSDGDVTTLGGGAETGDGFINAGACRSNPEAVVANSENKSLIQSYLSGNSSAAAKINANAAKSGGLGIPRKSLLGIGTAGGGSSGNQDFSMWVDLKALTSFNLGSIVKINHSRVSAFPDFIMDWVNRQLEEVVNKLTSLPTLYIILPDMRGVFESGWSGFTNKIDAAYSAGAAGYKEKNFNNNNSSGDGVIANTTNSVNNTLQDNAGTINSAGRNVSGVKAAYEFLSRLPMLKFESSTLDITVPIISEEDLNKAERQWTAAANNARKELDSKKAAWAKLGTKDGADQKLIVQSEGLISSIESNIRTIQDYKRFPEKLSKYLTWKERYAYWALCNVESVEKIMGGWISNNGKRFRAWVELTILIKAILKSWQIIPDLFTQYSAECGVCRNERHDAKYFIFKLISALIPKIPVLRFPKWPDIVLDLHNIRLGLRILMPTYHFNTTPIILPRPPKLFLPDTPSLTIGFPTVPQLPNLPPLPNLPTPPSLPNLTLPELPPPPTIPKIFGVISATLNILKIVKKVMCIMRTNPFVPEWRAGDQIAQITERQGKIPGIDYINIEYPQFNASFVDAIKVTTFVNLEFQVDFLLELSKATFAPLNRFTSDLSNLGNTKPVGDFNFREAVPKPERIDIGTKTGFNTEEIFTKFGVALAYSFKAALKEGARLANESLELQEFKTALRNDLLTIKSGENSKIDAIKHELQRGLNYDGAAEDAFIKQLESDNAEKFRIAKEYLKDESERNRQLQAQIGEIMNGKKTLEDVFGSPKEHTLVAASITQPVPLPDLSRFEERTQKALLALSEPDPALAELAAEGNKLRETVRTMSAEAPREDLQFAGDEATAASGNASTAGYEYRGIYMIDNGVQTRLFDYTDELLGDEKVVRIDPTKQNEADLIYKIGDSLFIKYPRRASPPKNVTTSIRTYSLENILPDLTIPTAPNNFHERFVGTNEINLSFSPARKADDNIFRLEFFEYIDRFDRMMAGEQPSQIDPRTVHSYVDLFPDLDNETLLDASKTGLVLRKQKAFYTTGRGNATMSAPAVRILSNSDTIQVGGSRTIYTDAGGARIKYAPIDKTSSGGILVLPKNTEAEFQTTMDIEVINGNILLPGLSNESSTVNLTELKGQPVFPGTKIDIDLQWARIDLGYFNGASLEINGPAVYEYATLGPKSDNYSVNLQRDNNWYYARLWSVGPTDNEARARLTLFSPQYAADNEAPSITLGQSIRVPVYLTQTVDMNEYTDDVSGVKDMYFDTDLTKDADGDGNKANDRDSDAPNNIIHKTDRAWVFSVWPGSKLENRPIRFWVADENNNSNFRNVTLDVYAPVPNITSSSGTLITGSLDETLTGEPIDILRYRNGGITRIGKESKTSTGTFTNALTTGTGIILKSGNDTIANIDEFSGLIEPKAAGLNITVEPATKDTPMNIFLRNQAGSILYRQSFALSKNTSIESVSDASKIKNKGIWVITSDDTIFVRNGPNATSLPGGGYVTTADRKAVAGLSQDGNIYLLASDYRLTYRANNGRVVIELRDSKNSLMTSFIYNIHAEFIVK